MTAFYFPDRTETEVTPILQIMGRVLEFGQVMPDRRRNTLTVMGLTLIYDTKISGAHRSHPADVRILTNRTHNWTILITTYPADASGVPYLMANDAQGRYRKFDQIPEGYGLWGREGLVLILGQSFTGDVDRCKRDLVIARMIGEEHADWKDRVEAD